MRGKVADWRTWDRGTILLGCWSLFPILFFSLSTSKLPGYILPSLPPLALLLGHGLAELIHSSGGNRTLKMAHWFCLFLSLGVAAAFPLVMRQSFGASWQTGLTMAAAVLLPALFVFWFARRGWLLAAVQATVVQGLILVLAVTQFGFPALAAYQSTRDIAHQALTAGAGGEPIITYAYFQHTLHYYTGYRIRENVVDLPSLAEYARQQPRFLVVTEAARLPELQSLPELSIAILGGQGPIRLLRITAVRQ
jgi:4-amino-4-deoxy-L-arabinose transferase-like glycosyltransferase